MVDDVARALCWAAGTSSHDALAEIDPDLGISYHQCVMCEKQPDGRLVCKMWTSFKSEAEAAIVAAYKWNRQHKRWPGWVKND